MEIFEFQKYRDTLAKEIRQEPDKEKRREIFANAKLTEEYHEAKRLKQETFTAKEESKVQTERLLQYAQEHYEEYTAFDPDTVALLNVIGENREKFENEVLPNVSDELIDKIIAFTEGNRDEQIVALLKRANFDYEALLAGEGNEQTKVRALLEAVLKAQSYDEAVEQNKVVEIDFSGFENDPDIPDAKEFVYRVFGAELLQKCLISKVKYAPDRANVQINGADYMLPVDVYAEWEKVMPEVKNRKFRAESFVLWNTDPNFSKKFIPTPVHFYSFHGEQPEQLDYLSHISAEQKMRQYKLGTITHEVAHHVYDYLIDADKRTQWRELVDRTQTITAYAKSYAEHKLKYNEFFTEAVRLKTTTPDYLKTNFPKIDQFLTDNFPDIKL
ncbi:MAG: hypothetical protein G01um101429_525 [Parcubacteria group bacterium Gr01-1014_29]|nr:MAG: hypothetical protein G01um101429_525 [Parcubacteria group bacterium Gr01-1014_29]